MIIWRGWGILAIAFAGLPAIAGAGIFKTLGADNLLAKLLVISLFAASAAGLWFFGVWLNQARPSQRIEEHLAERSAQYDQLIAAGQFQAAPGVAVPTHPQIARAQADQLIAQERQELLHTVGRNQHTLFFIPMQWLSIAVLSIGMLLVVTFR